MERNEGFFGPQAAQFLSLIDHTGSMQTACRQMHMSYTKGWKILKEAERQLGYPLLITQSGGAEGGFSQLTPKSKDFWTATCGWKRNCAWRGNGFTKNILPGRKRRSHENIIYRVKTILEQGRKLSW